MSTSPPVAEYASVNPRAVQPRWMTIAGWVIGLLPALFMLSGGIMTLANPNGAMMKEGMNHLGYPMALLVPIALLETIVVVLYLVPPTAVLGAILTTGYLGGAIASHVRVQEKDWLAAAVMGVLLWLGLYLRDPRVRALIPIRRG